MKKVGMLVFLFSFGAQALEPLEGRSVGTFIDDEKYNPLASVFEPDVNMEKRKSILKYSAFIKRGEQLESSCSKYAPLKFADVNQKNHFERTIVSQFQFDGLGLIVKAVGAYAKALSLSKQEFEKLSKNLVNNFCSKNITFISQKNIEANLLDSYNKELFSLPLFSEGASPSDKIADLVSSPKTREREFDYLIENFKSFCSWGGDPQDLRLLAPFLKDPMIFSHFLEGYKNTGNKFISCDQQLCRNSSFVDFKMKLPPSIGSTGIVGDVTSLYCYHLREREDFTKGESSRIHQMVKEKSLESPLIETNFFISLLTNVPDLFISLDDYSDIKKSFFSSTDDRWEKWSKSSLSRFSQETFFEEPISFFIKPRHDPSILRLKGFELNLNLAVGEIDKVLLEKSLSSMFKLKISKNYLRQVRTKWTYFDLTIDLEGKKLFQKEVAVYLMHQLQIKDKIFKQSLLSPEVAQLLANELIQQAIAYKGPLFDELKDEMLDIPVRVSYGFFALQYLAYKLDVQKDRFR